jgi:hypothetical protein
VTLTIAILISMGVCSRSWADACPVAGCSLVDVDAAAMVRAVRGSEQWIHQVESLFLRMESVWTSPCACGGAGADASTSKGLLEYAFDGNRPYPSGAASSPSMAHGFRLFLPKTSPVHRLPTQTER